MSKATQPEIIRQLVAAVNAHPDASPFELDAVCAPTGSRVICTPPVMDTDDDWLVFVPESMVDFVNEYLEKAGATHSEEQEHYPDGVVWWFGELNIIVLYDYPTFYRWVAATYYARLAGLNSKQARKDFFGAMIDMRPTLDSLTL